MTQSSVNFGSAEPIQRVVKVTVTDPGVEATSAISASVAIDPTRDSDEAEMDPAIAVVGDIVANTSYDVYVHAANRDSFPHGLYNLNTVRW